MNKLESENGMETGKVGSVDMVFGNDEGEFILGFPGLAISALSEAFAGDIAGVLDEDEEETQVVDEGDSYRVKLGADETRARELLKLAERLAEEGKEASQVFEEVRKAAA
tara:strand:+ start:121 stop:450 length:330 start_codon:yes stop_codon:yes gene_type:complete